MQDNPPPPGDNQAPHEPEARAQPDQQPPEEARAPENAAPPSPKEPPRPQSPEGNVDANLKRVGLSDARRAIGRDGESAEPDGESGSASGLPLPPEVKEKLEWVSRVHHRRAGNDPFTRRDRFTRYERGMDILIDRLPPQHPASGNILSLCNQLQETIDFVRQNAVDTPENQVHRNQIIGELHNQSTMAIEVSFYTLSGVSGPGSVRDDSAAISLKTEEDVGDWYVQLTGFEQCYVIAACVLQGAPSHEVSRAANELHLAIERTYSPRPSSAIDDSAVSHDHDALRPVRILAQDVLKHTNTVAEKHDGVERIMWRDDVIDPLVRGFLARQATTVGMRFANRNLLDILEEWVLSGDEECAPRAGLMLADLWWRQHQDRVLNLAETWAHSTEENVWQGGAALLYGAYAAERAEHPAMRAEDSEALRCLRDWADWRDDADLAQVAAYTYGLIGRQWPDVALDGLDHLLCLGEFARTNNAFPPLSVVFMAMLSYIEMATAGQVRSLLNRFADHASDYARPSPKGRAVFEDAQSSSVRERRLDMLFFHVVFLVALSLDGVQRRKTHASYLINVGLRQFPVVPSSRGQDVLLAGVLAEPEREWRANVRTLFCAAILSGRKSFVFAVLASWVRIVTYEPHGDATEALVHFVADLHRQLKEWDKKEQRHGPEAGAKVLEQRLSFWTNATHEHDLRPFALRVLDALDK